MPRVSENGGVGVEDVSSARIPCLYGCGTAVAAAEFSLHLMRCRTVRTTLCSTGIEHSYLHSFFAEIRRRLCAMSVLSDAFDPGTGAVHAHPALSRTRHFPDCRRHASIYHRAHFVSTATPLQFEDDLYWF